MGLIYSAFCMISFCVERVLTWACCACALMTLLFIIMLLMIYGVSVGYGYAQQELAAFAKSSRENLTKIWTKDRTLGPTFPQTPWRRRRQAGRDAGAPLQQPGELPTAENQSPVKHTNPLYSETPDRLPGVQGYPKTTYVQKASYTRKTSDEDAPYAQESPYVKEAIYGRQPSYSRDARVQDAMKARDLPYSRETPVQDAMDPQQAPVEDAEEYTKSQETLDVRDVPSVGNPYPQAGPDALEATEVQEAIDARNAAIAQDTLLTGEMPDSKKDPDAIRKMYSETSPSPVIILPTERPPLEPEMLPHEKELAKKLVGRYRRSKASRHLTV